MNLLPSDKIYTYIHIKHIPYIVEKIKGIVRTKIPQSNQRTGVLMEVTQLDRCGVIFGSNFCLTTSLVQMRDNFINFTFELVIAHQIN